jgi:hypothetical protein
MFDMILALLKRQRTFQENFYCDPSVTSARIPKLPATVAPYESTTVNVFPSLET